MSGYDSGTGSGVVRFLYTENNTGKTRVGKILISVLVLAFSWIGFNVKYIPYEVQQRNAGESKWGFRKLVKYALEGISAFSTKPLKMAIYLGLFTAFMAILYLIVVVIQRLFFNTAVSGYATIVVLILLLGGIQLFCIGLIGSYLAKTYIQSKRRPIYIAKEILKRETKEKTDR